MIRKLLKEESVRLGARPKSAEDVLRLAAELLSTDRSDVNADEIFRLLNERERLGSTGIGGGIAIPHASPSGAARISMALITIPDGVDFNSIDGKPVRAVFAMTAPADQRSAHVRNLAELSRLVKDPGFMDRLGSATAFSELTELFRSDDDGDEKSVPMAPRSLLLAVVQKDEYLEPLLEVLAGISDTESLVLDGHGAGRYLQALPLFSMFWTDEAQRTDVKVVMAVINRHAGNEAIRRITSTVADPASEEGLLVAIQDLSLVSGSLEL